MRRERWRERGRERGRERWRACVKGFTLVEVVVALALLSLVLLGLVGALRSFGQTGVRLEAQTLAADDLRLVGGLLQRTIARASARIRVDSSDQPIGTWFTGAPDGLVWLGQLPARHGVGGLHHLRLFVERDAGPRGGGRLLLQWVPFTGDENPPDWAASEPRVLLDELDALRLQYQGAGEADWRDAWTEHAVLPERVGLVVTVRGRRWPPVVIRLEQAEPASGIPASLRTAPAWRS